MTLCENYLNPFVNYSENEGTCGSQHLIGDLQLPMEYMKSEDQQVKTNKCHYTSHIHLVMGFGGVQVQIMTVLYDHEFQQDICLSTSSNLEQPYYGVFGCTICNEAGVNLTLPNSTAKDFLVNDDQNIIFNYWKQSKIQIGFANGNSTSAHGTSGKLFEYFASRTPYVCSTWSPTSLLNTFTLLNGNQYEVVKPISSAGTLFPANSNFYLEVLVNFKDGTTISRKECISVSVPTSVITVQLFGKIKDYDQSIINYQIKIYQ